MKESSITVNVLQDNKGLGKIPVFPKTVQGNRVTSLNIIPILSKWNHNRHIANLKFYVFYPPIRRWSDKLWFKKITRSTHKAVLCLLFFFLSWNAGYGQDVVYVSPDGTGDGSSWGQASSLADAVDNASAGDEIWLRQGTYTVSATIIFNKRLEILGGFSGSGDQRDPSLYPSIIDGQGSVHMIQTGGGSSNTLFDGISFINGYANVGVDENDIKGGALYISGNGTRINNCIFRDNTSANRIGSGAIYLWSANDVVIDGCVFENNRVIQNTGGEGNIGGGAIHVRFGSNTRILNTAFRNNYSRYAGGAVHDWGDNTVFENCVFDGNESEEDGGAVYINGDNTVFENCVFEGNESEENGGAVYVRNDYTHITNCIFIGNRGTDGGGVASNFGGVEISVSYFEGNQAQGRGGAIYNHRFASPSAIERTRFSTNTADLGGAIYNFSEEGLKIIGSLFEANQATDEGGAIFNNRFIEIANTTLVANINTALVHNRFQTTAYNRYQTTVYNSIFYLNTAKSSSYLADIAPSEGGVDASDKDVRNNIVQEFSGGSNNQVGVDPQFVNAVGGDYRLSESSPAINAGDESLYNDVSDIDASSSTDLDDNPRLFGAAIDMGAYELQDEPIEIIPNCTAITAPLDGATDVSLLPTIQWDAVTNATGYLLTIGTTATGGEVLNNEDVGNVTSYTVTTELEENTAYYIHVVPYNNVGEATGCSEISFTTETLSTIPNCTTITAPTNGAEDVALDADITWNAVDGADGYRIFIGTSPGGSDIVNGEEVTGTSYSVVSGFEENTTYYVSVVPFNAVGEATGCSEISFTTETLPAIPDCTSITAPANGAEDAALDADITWNAVDGADGYRIFIGTSPGGSDIVNGEEVTGTSYSVVGGFEENTTYYVSVVPFNSVGDATDCMEITFTTLTTALAPITGLSFLDGSFVYDGTEHTLSINGTPPTGAVIDYATNGRVDVGEQTVTVTVSAPGYETLVLEAGLEITPAPLVIRADPHNKTYGENDPPLTYTYDGLADGDTDEVFTGRLAREVGEDIGGYQILQGDLSAGGNYTINFVGATFTIEPAIIEGLSFEDGNFVYDGTEHHLAISGPLPPNASVNYSNNGRTDAGVQTVTVTVSAPNYQEIGVEAVLEITPAPLSISADPYTKLYGSPDPEWTYNADGLVGGDVINGALSREPGEEVGEYIILQGTLSAGGNYEMNFIPGQLSIYRGVDAMHVPDAPLEIYGNEQLSVHIQIQNIWTVAYERGDEVVLRLDAGAGLDIVRVESADLDIIQQYGVWVLRPTGIWEPSAFRHLEITLAGNGVDEDSSSLYIAVWNPQNMGAQADVGLQLDVLVEQGIEELIIPNVFTPNGDGINDRFEITGLRSYDYVKLLVVNQFGIEIYRNENYQNMWMALGIIDGTYYYLVQAYRGWEKREYRGYVLIKRQ